VVLVHGGWINLHFIVQKYSKSSRLAILFCKEKILTKVKQCFMGNVKFQNPHVPKTGSGQGGSLLAFWEHLPLGAFTIVKVMRQKFTWTYTILDHKWVAGGGILRVTVLPWMYTNRSQGVGGERQLHLLLESVRDLALPK
jgi:hypothetical protein